MDEIPERCIVNYQIGKNKRRVFIAQVISSVSEYMALFLHFT